MKQAVKSKNLRTSAPAAAPSAVDFPVIGIGASELGVSHFRQPPETTWELGVSHFRPP